jgi:hypothetical protein
MSRAASWDEIHVQLRRCGAHLLEEFFRGETMAYHLAQINIARLIAPIDDPKIAGLLRSEQQMT